MHISDLKMNAFDFTQLKNKLKNNPIPITAFAVKLFGPISIGGVLC